MAKINDIMIDIEDFAKRFKLRFIMEIHGISMREIKISMKQYSNGFQIVIEYYIVMKNGSKRWKFVPAGKGKKRGGIVPGSFVPVPGDPDPDLKDLEDEDFEPMIEILTKDPQAGKTHDGIVAGCVLSHELGRFPIVIIPSKIGLQKQTTSRVADGVEVDFVQDIKNLNEIQKKIIKENPKVFTTDQIGRWDTGSKGKGKLSGKISKDIKKIREGKIKALVVLDNKAGISKLIVLLAYLKDKNVDIIIDEAHSVLNIGPMTRTFERQYSYFDGLCEDFPEEEAVSYTDVPFDKEGRKMWIIKKFLERQGGISITGLTATVSYLTQNQQLKDAQVEFPVIKMNIPECYIGYKKCVKKIYDKEVEDAFRQIILLDKENPNGTTVMLHSGHKQESHHKACETWTRCCKENGIDSKKIGAMTDNSAGYCLYDSENKLVKKIEKNGPYTEPWQAVNEFKKQFPFLGIFGDMCMGESNTYQKCTKDVNCPINHMVMHGLKKYAYKDLTKPIQKSGRIFGNDTSGKDNKRSIWFSCAEEQKRYEHGFKLDKHLQNKGQEVSLAMIDFKTENKLVKKKNFDLDGKEVEYVPRGPNVPDTPDEIEMQFNRWYKTRNQTKIAKMMRKLDAEKIYTKQQFLDIAHSVGFKNKDIISNMSRSLRTQNGYGNIIEVNDENIRIRPEIKNLYTKYFKNNN